MRVSPSVRFLTLTVAVLAAVVVALVTAVCTGVLARWDGASIPTTLLRAGAAFGAALTLACGLIALTTTVLT